MDTAYSFDVDVEHSLVRMTLTGFFTPADIATFNAERHAQYARLRCARNQHVTLVDMRGMVIQSQDAVSGFATSLADPVTKSRRIAFVVPKSLNRLQVKRAANGRYAAYFGTLDEAERWLLADEAQAA